MPAYCRSITARDQAWLDAIAAALLMPRELLCQLEDLYRGVPDKRSTWAQDRRNTLSGPGGLWGQGPVDHHVALSLLYLRVCGDHLAGVAALYQAGEVFYAPRPLIRSAFEHGTRVSWILDPTADLHRRCARALLDEYGSAIESNKAVRHLGERDSVEAKLTKRILRDVRAHIGSLFDPSGVMLEGSRRKWQIEGESALLPTDVAEFHAGAHGGHVSGIGIYDALSLFDHPQGFLAREAPIGEEGASTFEVTSDFLGRLTTAGVTPFYSGLALVLSYTGWSLRSFDRWEAQIERLFPGSLLTPP